ncbi:hypothetical protein PPACK8108_LOCUS6314 [Phakopsora pachyrhizi]|uniref:Uncharacterized protein n=1 Tax=Phakopsora pachyrhizi TaxID=170000 RepID=A0AAV0ATK0_PHAPC|nr:hypothetical protein PPACK8108_LOCUS6314 [Phakopsora pachyrhizi]
MRTQLLLFSYLAPRNERDTVIDEEFEDKPLGEHGSDLNRTETVQVEAADYSAKSKNLVDSKESLNTTLNLEDNFLSTSTRPTSVEKDHLNEGYNPKENKAITELHCSRNSTTDKLHSSNNGGNNLTGDNEEYLDVFNTPKGGEWDIIEHCKKPSNTLFL